ncbi:MAG: GtrA family protein [Candidatus Moranbacteria bacterium]|nr:GtrA family protein [Candidatus Moranbacteria bacterium]
MNNEIIENSPLMAMPADQGLFLKLVKQFSKFIIVGGINTGIDFFILNILIYITGVTAGVELFILNCISFSVAVINSYFMNKHWTFQDKTKTQQEPIKFSQFLAVSIIGIIINGLILTSITSYIPPLFGLSAVLWANIAKLMATGVSLIWNFIGYKFFVFKK